MCSFASDKQKWHMMTEVIVHFSTGANVEIQTISIFLSCFHFCSHCSFRCVCVYFKFKNNAKIKIKEITKKKNNEKKQRSNVHIEIQFVPGEQMNDARIEKET